VYNYGVIIDFYFNFPVLYVSYIIPLLYLTVSF